MPKLLNYYQADKLEAGCDEAGRGCYAGPVFAAAVILPVKFYHPLLNDSKQLSAKQRDWLRPIIEKEAISFGVSQISNDEIDQITKLDIKIIDQNVNIKEIEITDSTFITIKKDEYTY